MLENLGIPIRVSYAQNREDIFLDNFFKDVDKGFYVDVGANDPIEDSVTKIFYDKGWSGINIEPIKRLHSKLAKERPRDINLNIGISSKNGTAEFREYHTYHGLSTMASPMKDEYEDNSEDSVYQDYEDYQVEVKTLASVFKELKVKHIQFMKIDVEGLEYDVIKGNDWKKYRPEVLCIESNHILKDWRQLLSNADYKLKFNDGLNDYYVAEEAVVRGDNFSYVQAALPLPVLKYNVARAISDLYKEMTSEKNAAVYKNADLALRIERLEHNLYIARNELEALSGLKNLIKKLISVINFKIENKIYPMNERNKIFFGRDLPIEISDDSSLQYQAIEAYDSQYFKGIKTTTNLRKKKSLERYYQARRAAGICLRGMFKSVMKIKRIVRG